MTERETGRAAAAERARRSVLVTAALLAAVVVTAVLRLIAWPASAALAALALIPVLLPLRGMLGGLRGTHAWATLCATPYIVAGVMEAVANPAMRVAGVCLVAASLAWFAALVRYLRVTRPATEVRAPGPPGPA